MAISIIGTNQAGATTNGGNVTLTFNVTPAIGDDVYVWGGHFTRVGTNYGPTDAAYQNLFLGTSTGRTIGLWKKTLTAADANVVGYGSGNAVDGAAYNSIVIRGGNHGVLDQTITPATGASGTPNPPSVTTQTTGALIIAYAASSVNDASTGTVTSPAGYSAAFGTNANASTNDLTVAGSTHTTTTTVTEDPTWSTSWSSGNWVAITVAIRPAAPFAIAPAAANLALSPTAPDVLVPVAEMVPPHIDLAITAFAPVIAVSTVWLAADDLIAAAPILDVIPQLTYPYFRVPTRDLVITRFAPTIVVTGPVEFSVTSFSVQALFEAPTASALGLSIIPDAAQVVLTPTAPAPVVDHRFAPAAEQPTLTTSAPEILIQFVGSYSLTPPAADIVITSTAPIVTVPKRSFVLYNEAKKYLMQGDIDLNAIAFRMALYTSASNADTMSLSTLDQLTGEVIEANGYSSSGKPLIGTTWDTGDTPAIMRLDCDPIVWRASGGNIDGVKYAVCFVSGSNKLVGRIMLLASEFTLPNGSTMVLDPPNTGLFQLQ